MSHKHRMYGGLWYKHYMSPKTNCSQLRSLIPLFFFRWYESNTVSGQYSGCYVISVSRPKPGTQAKTSHITMKIKTWTGKNLVLTVEDIKIPYGQYVCFSLGYVYIGGIYLDVVLRLNQYLLGDRKFPLFFKFVVFETYSIIHKNCSEENEYEHVFRIISYKSR